MKEKCKCWMKEKFKCHQKIHCCFFGRKTQYIGLLESCLIINNTVLGCTWVSLCRDDTGLSFINLEIGNPGSMAYSSSAWETGNVETFN